MNVCLSEEVGGQPSGRKEKDQMNWTPQPSVRGITEEREDIRSKKGLERSQNGGRKGLKNRREVKSTQGDEGESLSKGKKKPRKSPHPSKKKT